jgi:hypothetical protein
MLGEEELKRYWGPEMELRGPRAILSMLLIHIVAIVTTLLVPGSIAKLGHVFYEEETITRLPPAAKQKYGELQQKEKRLRLRIDQLDGEIDRLLAVSVTDDRIPVLIDLLALGALLSAARLMLQTARCTLSWGGG